MANNQFRNPKKKTTNLQMTLHSLRHNADVITPRLKTMLSTEMAVPKPTAARTKW
jgi:hypothetical protein